jgi:phospholipid/cholesterol/gamma-HCH transport system substrate-binding protein
MATSLSSFRVGFFVVLGVSALLAAVVLVGTQEGLFQSTFHVSAYFNSVEGVRAGSAVRLAGVDIGVVDKVELSPQETKVHLYLKLNTGMKSFVKKDSYATVMPEGLVGSYYVDVTSGSRTGESIEDGDIIQSKEVLRLSTVMENTVAIMENIRRASNELTKTLVTINEGHGTVGKLIASEDVYRHLERMASRGDSGLAETLCNIDTLSVSARDVIHRTDSLVSNVNTMVTRLNAGRGTVGALLTERAIYDSLLRAVNNTVMVTEEAKVGAGRFSEDMEALKHHWLLRGYFEDRGYWDEVAYQKELDRKIDSLKILERDVTSQMQELERRNAMNPR